MNFKELKKKRSDTTSLLRDFANSRQLYSQDSFNRQKVIVILSIKYVSAVITLTFTNLSKYSDNLKNSMFVAKFKKYCSEI